MNIPKKYRKEHYRACYELLWESPRIHAKQVAMRLGLDQRTASARLSETSEQGIVVGPEMRKKSFGNLGEYMYFANCEDPDLVYQRFQEDEKIIFHALMYGFANVWVVSKEKVAIEGDVVVEGWRSDYYVAFAPDHSWDDAIQSTRKKIEEFDLEEYTPKGYVKTHFGETVEWSEKDEILYRYFKYDVRKPFTPLGEKCLVSWKDCRLWLKKIPECCTIATSYFPEGLSAYEPYLFSFETEYEDFVIELFSELPASSWFFKVADKLFLYAHVPKKYIKDSDSRTAPNKLSIPLLGNELLERGIIRRRARAPIEMYWAKDR